MYAVIPRVIANSFSRERLAGSQPRTGNRKVVIALLSFTRSPTYVFLRRTSQTFGYTSRVPMRAAPRKSVAREFYHVIALVSDITCLPALRASIDSGLFISNCKKCK